MKTNQEAELDNHPLKNQEVEKEFSEIENDERDVLDYYRRLREQNWNSYKKKPKSSPKYQYSRPRYQPRLLPTKKVDNPKARSNDIPKEPWPDEKVEELKIEARQHMSYFCIKMERSSRFSSPAECSAFTENVLNDCEKKHPTIFDRSLISCLKKQL